MPEITLRVERVDNGVRVLSARLPHRKRNQDPADLRQKYNLTVDGVLAGVRTSRSHIHLQGFESHPQTWVFHYEVAEDKLRLVKAVRDETEYTPAQLPYDILFYACPFADREFLLDETEEKLDEIVYWSMSDRKIGPLTYESEFLVRVPVWTEGGRG